MRKGRQRKPWLPKLSKTEKSWAMYDWANSAYILIITVAIFPLYFGQVARADGLADTTSTAFLAYGNSIAALLIAVLSPILGTIADYKRKRMGYFRFFLFVGVGTTMLLGVTQQGSWVLVMVLYICTTVGYAGSNLFYDTFLVDVTKRERMDMLSTLGYGYGYIGSAIPFIVCLVIIYLLAGGDFSTLNITGIRITFIVTALWWLLFSIPLLKNVRQTHGAARVSSVKTDALTRAGPLSVVRTVGAALGELRRTFHNIRRYKHIFLFLLAYFFYIDGVNTIVRLAADFGSKIGISSLLLLVDLLAIQIVAFPFTLLYGRLAKRTSPLFMLFVGISTYLIITCIAFLLPMAGSLTTPLFLLISLMVATSQGGLQALSRSFFATLIPLDHAGEFFGFYEIFGKFAAILGPFLFGFLTQVTGSFSLGIGSVSLLFLAGGLCLFICRKEITAHKK